MITEAVTRKALSVTGEAPSVTRKALSVTGEAPSVTRKALSADVTVTVGQALTVTEGEARIGGKAQLG